MQSYQKVTLPVLVASDPDPGGFSASILTRPIGKSLLSVAVEASNSGKIEAFARTVVADILEALRLAHSRGICHRDVRMANVIRVGGLYDGDDGIDAMLLRNTPMASAAPDPRSRRREGGLQSRPLMQGKGPFFVVIGWGNAVEINSEDTDASELKASDIERTLGTFARMLLINGDVEGADPSWEKETAHPALHTPEYNARAEMLEFISSKTLPWNDAVYQPWWLPSTAAAGAEAPRPPATVRVQMPRGRQRSVSTKK